MKLVAKKTQGVAALIAGLAALAWGAKHAEASPPSSRGAALTRVTVEAPRSSGSVRNERESARLDLRAPTDFAAARAASKYGVEPSASSAVTFTSPRRAAMNEPVEENFRSLGNTGLGNTGLAMKNISPAEDLTRRFHREGLPVARLWETHSAMLSLGLSPAGQARNLADSKNSLSASSSPVGDALLAKAPLAYGARLRRMAKVQP